MLQTASRRTCAHAASLRRPFTLTPGNSARRPHRRFWRDRPVFVTGATGLARRLAGAAARSPPAPTSSAWSATGCRARSSSPAGLLDQVSVVRGDVRDQETLERALGEYEIATVFHLAAQTTVGVANRNPVSTLDTNIRGTWALLEACRRSPTVEQIVIASSDKAYGDQDVLPYTEDAPLLGRHPYDVSKSCADLLAQMYAKTLRPAGVRHALRQLLRRRRPELEPPRARDDPLGAARRAPGDPVGRPVHRATTSTSRTARAPTCCWPSSWRREPELAGEVFNFSNEQQMTVLGAGRRGS